MKPITISCGFFLMVFVAGAITQWIRHRPANLTRGTQHILLTGLMIQPVFLGVAIAFLVRSFSQRAP